jgi:hypothetical protein
VGASGDCVLSTSARNRQSDTFAPCNTLPLFPRLDPGLVQRRCRHTLIVEVVQSVQRRRKTHTRPRGADPFPGETGPDVCALEPMCLPLKVFRRQRIGSLGPPHRPRSAVPPWRATPRRVAALAVLPAASSSTQSRACARRTLCLGQRFPPLFWTVNRQALPHTLAEQRLIYEENSRPTWDQVPTQVNLLV